MFFLYQLQTFSKVRGPFYIAIFLQGEIHGSRFILQYTDIYFFSLPVPKDTDCFSKYVFHTVVVYSVYILKLRMVIIKRQEEGIVGKEERGNKVETRRKAYRLED